MNSSAKITTRGLMIHITHYDPIWCGAKKAEKPFDLDVALELVEAMARHEMNLLVVDCEDGVRYKSHPELRRHYSVDMGMLAELAAAARRRGIDVVPKLNFAKSGRNLHDQWMSPHWDPISWLNDLQQYWKVAEDVIAELVRACQPRKFFHIGMDEDHYRSLPQYVDAIKTLRLLVKKHRLRTVIWNDSCHDQKTAVAQVHAQKCRNAEEFLPRDIVQVLWDYNRAHPKIVRRLVEEGGFEIWVAPGREAENVLLWRRAAIAGGANGLLMTRWIKCNRENRGELLRLIEKLAPHYLR